MTMMKGRDDKRDPIAIVGIGLKMPGGAETPEEFWEMLKNKTDAIRDIPADRWDKDAYFNPNYEVSGKMNVRQGGFIDDMDKFDAGFFGIPPVEAMRLDPQQRMLLERSYLAFEDGGFRLEDLSGGRVGVFIGISAHDYGDIHNAYAERMNLGPHSNTGNAVSIASNRISYIFNLMGPSFSVDTACSSSLIAAHLACRSLWYGESNMALIGGVNAILKPELQIGFSRGGFLSKDARCFTFDERANGYIRSEGCGVMLLKRLSDAQRDGDKIYATIIGSAINEDGRTAGISMPGIDAQVKVLTDAYNDAGIEPKQLHYVECHGTGTAVGDPVEGESIGNLAGKHKAAGERLIIGSVKSNIGHLEPASGMAGLIKLAMALKNRQVPPNINFEIPNPKIDFDGWKLQVPTEMTDLPKEGPIYAGINSFGFGGANAHLVLQSAPQEKKQEKKTAPKAETDDKLFTFSARTEEALAELSKNYIDFLDNNNPDLDALCYTSATRRSAHDLRVSTVFKTKDELKENLTSIAEGEDVINTTKARKGLKGPAKVGFVFSGQGPQWFGMGRELMESCAVFKDTINKIDAILKDLGWLKSENSSLIKELSKSEEDSRINETEIAQPAIFAVQVALTEMWKSYGVMPDAIIGHSIGEVAASWASGALSLEEATRVVFWRSRAQASAAGKGRMLAVGVSEKEAKKLIAPFKGKIDIAAINAPKMLTLSGDTDALEDLADKLEEKGTFYRFLRVDVPFHSFLLDDIKDDFIKGVGKVKTGKTTADLYSTVTAGRLDGKEMDEEYWFKNIRQPVYYYPTIKKMIGDGVNTFVEIAPHPILSKGVEDSFNEMSLKGTVVPSIRRKEAEMPRFLASVGALFTWGYPVDWSKVYGERNDFIELPKYPFQRESFWIESEASRAIRIGKRRHPHLLSAAHEAKDADRFLWNVQLDHRTTPYIADHRVQGPIIFPGAGHVDLTIAAGLASYGENFSFIEDMNFNTALFLPDEGDPYDVQLEVGTDEGNFTIATRKGGDDGVWMPHSNGKINHIGDEFKPEKVNLEEIKKRVSERVDLDVLFTELDRGGLQLGPTFRGLTNLFRNSPSESLGEVRVHESILHDYHFYNIHPSVLDACFQTAFGILKKEGKEPRGVYIPVHIDRVKFYAKPKAPVVYSYARAIDFDEEILTANIWIMNEDGSMVAEFQNFQCQYLKGSKGEVSGEMDNWLYELKWYLKALPEEELNRKPENYLAKPTDLKKEADGIVTEVLKDPRIQKFINDFEPKLEDLTLSYIADSLDRLGFEFKKGEVVDVDALIGEYNVVARHYRLFNHMFLLLSRKGFTKREAEKKWKILKEPRIGMADDLLKELEVDFPEFHYELTLLRRCGPVLDEVVTGETDPVQLIFPEHDWESVVDYYINATSFNIYNRMMNSMMKEFIDRLPEEQTIRILEVGSGTGGMTQAVLPQLPPERTEYVFSDLSPMFIMQAQKRFNNYPFIEYRIVDIEKSPEEQGFQPNSFDIIIGSDVIHATRDLTKTLTNVKKYLAPKGMLALLEVTQTPIYLDLIFGTTEGWWLYEDTDLRQDHCTMPLKKWMGLFDKMKFTDVLPVSDCPDGSRSSQTLFYARNEDVEVKPVEKPEQEKGNWLVMADEKGLSVKITQYLESQDKNCVIVKPGKAYKKISDNEYEVLPTEKDEMRKLVDEMLAKDLPFQAIVHLWSVDAPMGSNLSADDLEKAQKTGVVALTQLLGAFEDAETTLQPDLFIVTTGSQTPTPNDNITISQTPLWGFTRVALNEPPNFPVHIIDLSHEPTDEEMEKLYKEFFAVFPELTEEEIAYRGRKRFVQKFMRVSPKDAAKAAAEEVDASGYPYHLEIKESGNVDQLVLRKRPVPRMAEDQMEIAVKAAPINFRDIMIAMGLLSDEAVKGGLFGKYYGLECTGIVKKVGKKVKNFKPGDEVVAFASDCIAGTVWAREVHSVKKPAHLSFDEVATLPMVYLTAYYGLHYQARMAKGEKVLIHAGAGGVGIAAIKLALEAGAEVYATASEKKWDFLKKLGVKHIFNSRNTRFYDEIMEATGGYGVDIVLNSLAGKMLTQSIKLLAPYGRFVEIGKADIYNNKLIGLKPFGDNLSYHAVDIDRLLQQKPELAGKLFKEVMAFFENKTFGAHPFQKFHISDVVEAFRYVTQAKHIGKVVISMEDKVSVSPEARLLFKKDASYLVVGGTGGFGLAVTKWMVSRGAGNVVVMSRSGVKEENMPTIEQMKDMGAKVKIVKGSATDKSDIQKAVKEAASMAPLKGVINSAMVLDDGMFPTLTEERIMKVMRPKMIGTWHLHNATKDMELDYFILFSSIAALYGTPAQSNYSAANSFLDKFADFRRSQGLPGITINWGVLGDVGFVSRDAKVDTILASQGWGTFSLRQSLNLFERVLLDKPIQRGCIDADWHKASDTFPQNVKSIRYAHLHKENDFAQGGGGGDGQLRDAILGIEDEKERTDLLMQEVLDTLARILGTSANKIDINVPITNLGLDSLMANQIRSWITNNLDIEYSLMRVMQGPTTVELTQQIIDEVLKGSGGSSSQTAVDQWIMKPKPNPQAAKRLLCFPYMGGGASSYQGWEELLDDSIELCLVQTPGRENRIAEEAIVDNQQLINKLVEHILPLTDKPLAFYGHSFGATMAKIVADKLQQEHDIVLDRIFMAAAVPDHLENPLSEIFDSVADDVSAEEIPQDLIVEMLRRLGVDESFLSDEDALAESLKATRADLIVMRDNKKERHDNVLKTPMTAMAAKKDEAYPVKLVKGWERYAEDFELVELDARHFFLSNAEEKPKAIEAINERLK